jgi:hypothetical protein
MVIFELSDRDTYKLAEAWGTRPGGRTPALDPKLMRLDTVTVAGSSDFGKRVNAAVAPLFPTMFFPNTFQILTYEKT